MEELFLGTGYKSRPYQIRILKKLTKKFGTLNNILLEAPCGSGKTCMGLLAAKYFQNLYNWDVAWVSHRKNLLKQVQDENLAKSVGLRFTCISMFDKNPPKGFDLVITDECHHEACDSMQHLYNNIQPKKILGLSASPWRSDRLKLCFQEIIKDAGIGALIREGYLSKYNHWTIPDYKVETVVRFYAEHKETWGKSAIYFHRIEQCEQAKVLLNAVGIRSDVVRGDNNAEGVIERFRGGEFPVILNCLKLTEGFNEPSLMTAFCKPSSKGVTMQMAGRAFRPYGDAIKNVVQCATTPYVFTKIANAINTYTWNQDRGAWLGLKPNPETGVAQRNTMRALASIQVILPKALTDRKTRHRRFRMRNV